MNCTTKENMIKLEAYWITSLEHCVTCSRTRFKNLDKKELISRYFLFMESEKLSGDPAYCSILEVKQTVLGTNIDFTIKGKLSIHKY